MTKSYSDLEDKIMVRAVIRAAIISLAGAFSAEYFYEVAITLEDGRINEGLEILICLVFAFLPIISGLSLLFFSYNFRDAIKVKRSEVFLAKCNKFYSVFDTFSIPILIGIVCGLIMETNIYWHMLIIAVLTFVETVTYLHKKLPELRECV